MSMQSIREALAQHGPMTAAEIGKCVKLGKSSVSVQIKSLRSAKEIYISKYKFKLEFVQGRNTAIYALGNQPDAISVLRNKRNSLRADKRERERERKMQEYTIMQNKKIMSDAKIESRKQLGIWAGLVS